MKKLLLTSIAALFLATGIAHTETNALGCFARAYDKAHLAEHPDQLVTAVKLQKNAAEAQITKHRIRLERQASLYGARPARPEPSTTICSS